MSVKAAQKVQVLMPASTVNALRVGFSPEVRLTTLSEPKSIRSGKRA